jgi:hypothetical protein
MLQETAYGNSIAQFNKQFLHSPKARKSGAPAAVRPGKGFSVRSSMRSGVLINVMELMSDDEVFDQLEALKRILKGSLGATFGPVVS